MYNFSVYKHSNGYTLEVFDKDYKDTKTYVFATTSKLKKAIKELVDDFSKEETK